MSTDHSPRGSGSRPGRFRAVGVALKRLVLLVWFAAAPVIAATFTVTNTDDTGAAAVGGDLNFAGQRLK